MSGDMAEYTACERTPKSEQTKYSQQDRPRAWLAHEATNHRLEWHPTRKPSPTAASSARVDSVSVIERAVKQSSRRAVEQSSSRAVEQSSSRARPRV
ncbi:uncharacterized protein N7482_006069 [Penicillium canariense]|uniref:Uncharacterized protein n=1 Tax=Penicillium canariense TaxID=189055 RepID=A0A9W9LP22_9EURO|nr:uncharacterized protein N7482_006069 [Penicillium canariense]KAJ5167288.1 hypothetical protein N7482_006069 [Penicillium canariense]